MRVLFWFFLLTLECTTCKCVNISIYSNAFRIKYSQCYIFSLNVVVYYFCLAYVPRGDSHMKQTGMLVGNFEFTP